MILTANIEKDYRIIFEKNRDIGRLHSKSSFGRIVNQGKLEISLLEAAFLLDEDKIKIKKGEKYIVFEEIVKKAAEKIPRFDILYTVFKDLRKRGCHVNIFDEIKKTDFDFLIPNKKDDVNYYVACFSERSYINIKKVKKLIEKAERKKGFLWFTIVDEEGDITYYDTKKLNPYGINKTCKYSKTKAFLIDDRTVIFNEKKYKKLFEKEFFGKSFGKGLQVSMLESLYLKDKKILDIKDINDKIISLEELGGKAEKYQPDIKTRLKIYSDLKNRGLIVKTGFKFGTHFRAYTKKPDEGHAEYLVQSVDKNFKFIWPNISRAVRLAHSVNKEMLFAFEIDDKINYVSLGRLRP